MGKCKHDEKASSYLWISQPKLDGSSHAKGSKHNEWPPFDVGEGGRRHVQVLIGSNVSKEENAVKFWE